MRPIWKGAISFGMVTIPVKLYTATEQKDIRFRMLHKKDGSPIQEKRFCIAEDKEVAYEDLVRGYEVSKGEFVILDPEEIEAAEPETAHTIDIGDFVDLDEIDPIYFEKSYFLEPDGVGLKPFNLLKAALEETRRIAVAKVAIRNKERLATLRVYDGTLVLETMYWPDEIREAAFEELEDEVDIRPQEMAMARSLIENMTGDFDPTEFRDEYREKLEELVAKKVEGQEITLAAEPEQEPTKVVDLMEALKASVEQAKKTKQSATKTTKKKTAARKASAS